MTGKVHTGKAQRWLAEHLSSDHPIDGCIIWPFSLQGRWKNTPVVQWERRKTRVSHVVLAHAGFPRPDRPNDHALHSCPSGDDPRCVNRNHLRWGSNQDNVDDRNSRGRQARGSKHGRSKLTEDDVALMREMHARGETQAKIARVFDVDPSTVSRIVRGDRGYWGVVPIA